MIFSKFLSFWRKYSSKQEDLFSYAKKEKRLNKKKNLSSNDSHMGLQSQTSDENKKQRRKPWLWLMGAILLFIFSFSIGYVIGKRNEFASVNRDIVIYLLKTKNRRQRAYWKKLQNGRIYLAQNTEIDPHYDPFSDDDENYIDLDNVRRIDLIPPKKEETKKKRKLRADEKRFLGRYRIVVSQHRGLFYVYRTRKGKLGASVRFTNWGKQKMEFLYSVRVWEKKIHFRRICRAKRCFHIGSNRALNQKFVGSISKNRKKIIGSYTGGQSGSRWSANRY